MGREPLRLKWFYDKMRHYYGGVSEIIVGGAYFGVLIDDDDEFRFAGVTNNFVAPDEVDDPIEPMKSVENKLILKRLNRLVEQNRNEIMKGLLQDRDDFGNLSWSKK
jgi:hypothetical protein